MNYRRDVRSEEEFKRDIKAGTIAEGQIIQRWLDLIEKKTGSRPIFRDNGCDNSGEYLDEKQVNSDPDYYVDGYGLIEVKFSNPKLNNILHLKVGQVDKILEANANILFANGWAVKGNTMFAFITPEQLGTALLRSSQVPWQGFGGKLAYKIRVNEFHWQFLP